MSDYEWEHTREDPQTDEQWVRADEADGKLDKLTEERNLAREALEWMVETGSFDSVGVYELIERMMEYGLMGKDRSCKDINSYWSWQKPAPGEGVEGGK